MILFVSAERLHLFGGFDAWRLQILHQQPLPTIRDQPNIYWSVSLYGAFSADANDAFKKERKYKLYSFFFFLYLFLFICIYAFIHFFIYE